MQSTNSLGNSIKTRTQEIIRLDDAVAALEAEESGEYTSNQPLLMVSRPFLDRLFAFAEMRLRIDGPFVTEALASLKYLCDETIREQTELNEQEKMALRTSKESAKVWLAALVAWGETNEKHKEQTDEDYAMMAAEASLIERKKQYVEFVKSRKSPTQSPFACDV